MYLPVLILQTCFYECSIILKFCKINWDKNESLVIKSNFSPPIHELIKNSILSFAKVRVEPLI